MLIYHRHFDDDGYYIETDISLSATKLDSFDKLRSIYEEKVEIIYVAL